MKKVALLSGIILGASLFTGCAYKTECGIDGCGDRYIDTTFRTYPNTYNTKCSTEILTKSNCKNYEKVPQKSAPKSIAVAKKQVSAPILPKNTPVLKCNKTLKVSVTGQGVAPCKGACSPAQAYALAKRAAIADAYRLLAEKVKGVYVEGDDYIKNMAVKKSIVRTHVAACIRNAKVTETTFKDGLCEVEMEISLSYANFVR